MPAPPTASCTVDMRQKDFTGKLLLCSEKRLWSWWPHLGCEQQCKRSMLALLVLMLALTCHLIYRPYDEPSLDHLEFFGLAAATVTLYFGMFFFTDDVVFAPWWGFVVTFTIMTVNSIFLAYFFLSLYAAFREESNTIKRLTTRCRVGIRTCRNTCLSTCGEKCNNICKCVCPCVGRHAELWVVRRIESMRSTKSFRENKGERDKHAADRHKNFDGFWLNSSSKTDAKAASKKRQREREASEYV